MTKLGHAAVFILSSIALQAHGQAHPGFAFAKSETPDRWGFFLVSAKNLSNQKITALWVSHVCTDPAASESATGFDALTMPSLAPNTHDLSILPDHTWYADISAVDPSCFLTTSALFADGHGEGDTAGQYGWPNLLRDRAATYDEINRLIIRVQELSDEGSAFPVRLAETVEFRRQQLSDRYLRDVPRDEVQARTAALRVISSQLIAGITPIKQFTTQEQTLAFLRQWLQPLLPYAPSSKSAN